MRLGTDLPSSPKDSLGEKPGLGSCTQGSEGETVPHSGAELFPISASAAPVYAVVPYSLLPLPTLPY